MKATVQRFDSGMHYLAVPATTAASFLNSGIKRILCRINRQHELHAAIQRTRENEYYIMMGLATLKKFQLKTGTSVSIEFLEDTTACQFYMPEELEEVLQTDPDAKTVFESLTDGNKRGLISLILQVKSVDKKIERALRIAQKIKQGVKAPQQVMKR